MRLMCALCVFVMTGCVTPYQKMTNLGGYRDAEVSPGIHEVVVVGSSWTSHEVLTGYFHRRALEICTTLGHRFYDFRISTGTQDAGYVITRNEWVTDVDPVRQNTVRGVITCMDSRPR